MYCSGPGDEVKPHERRGIEGLIFLQSACENLVVTAVSDGYNIVTDGQADEERRCYGCFHYKGIMMVQQFRH